VFPPVQKALSSAPVNTTATTLLSLAATGTRLSLTLSREMQARGVKYGIASACIGGGQGTAILFENPNA